MRRTPTESAKSKLYTNKPSSILSQLGEPRPFELSNGWSKQTEVPMRGVEVIISVRFNQDGTCLAISTSHGFRIYSVAQPTDAPVLLFKCDSLGIVTLIEMQFRSNICALVTRETFNNETSESLNAETRLDVS